MSTWADKTVRCGSCGRESSQQVLASTSEFGHQDLDTRPPQTTRSTMRWWIQRCPSCGYCARDLASFDEDVRAALDTEPYRAQLSDAAYPELAATFLCSGLLADARDDDQGAGWAYLHGAWVLDDAEEEQLAREIRSRAADCFLAATRGGGELARQPCATEAIVVDCLRRAGRGDEALAVIEEALRQDCGEVLQTVLRFQQDLIARGDGGCYRIDQAMEAP